MKLNRETMIELLKEEYEKRINYYLNLSEIETKDKSDNDLISSAIGLKVKDRAGFLYTVAKIFSNESGELMVRLLKPGKGLDTDYTNPSATTPIRETEDGEESKERKKISKKEEEKVTSPEVGSDIISKSKKMDFKRSFEPDLKSDSAEEIYGSSEENSEYIDIKLEDLEGFTL